MKCRGYKGCALTQLEKFNICVNTKLRKGEFIFAVAKRILTDRKARRDNFRTTVQATARIGILVLLCVYACECRARHEQFTLVCMGGRACA